MSIIKNITTSVRIHWRLLFSLLFFVVFGIGLTIFAAPSTSPYTPGETLDPTCTPGSTNCTVGILESRDEGTNLTYQTKALDFVGAGVVATESGGVTTVTISGGVSSAVQSLNGLTGSTQTFATGTTGSDFNISSTGTVHTFNFPTASASARGLLTSTDWSMFNGKQDTLSFSLPLRNTANTISIDLADTATDGYLSSSDWNTFNGKLQSSDFITSAGDNDNGIAISVSNQLSTTSVSITTTVADNSNTGVLSSTDWSTFNNKENTLTFSTGLTRIVDTITNNLSTGISGGQSVIGGTASGENLTLSSTSNVTKGSILFGNSTYDEANNRMAIGTTSFDGTNPEKLLVAAGVTSSVNVVKGTGSINSYLQLNIQNTNAGTLASSDVVATADNGSETTGYVDMGINSSGYTGGVMGVANDAYLYNIGAGSGGNLLIGTGSSGKSLYFLTGGTSQASNTRIQIDGTGNTTFTQGVSTSGSPVAFTLTGATHTTLATSTEASDVNFNLARIVQFNTGALTTQRAFRIQAPTYSFVGASTITDAATFAVTGAPIKGTNATITSSHGILVQAGAVSTATAAYGLTVNAPTGATTNLAAQFLDAATMSGAETFYPVGDFYRSSGTDGVKVGYWSRSSGTAEGGAIMGRSTSLILGAMSGTTPQRALTILNGANTPSMFFGTSTSPNSPYDFGMSGAITFYTTPNTTKWTGLVTSGIYTSSNGPIIYGSNGVNGSSFGDLVLQSRSLSTTSVGIVTGATPAVRMRIDGTGNTTFTQGVAATSTSPTAFTLTGAAHLALATSTEATDVNFNLARTVQFNTGALTTQRAFLIQAPTYSFVGSSTITDAATLAITGAPIKSTNATITNTHALLISASAVSTATNSYGLTVNAQTGATNNYAAQFIGGNVGIGTATPAYSLDVAVTASASSTKLRAANIVLADGSPGATTYGLKVDNQVVTSSGTNYGIHSTAIASTNSPGTAIAVYGLANTSFNSYGGYFVATTVNGRVGYGVYSSVGNTGGGTASIAYGGYFETTQAASSTRVIAANFNTSGATSSHYLFDGQNNSSSVFSVRGTGQTVIGSSTIPTGWLHVGANLSASAWGTTGININTTASTYTDTSTGAAGTVTNAVANAFGMPTLASTNAITVTNGANMYIAGGAIKGSNTTLTNSHALLIAAGAVSTATNSYGLTVNTQTGATNNYAAQFIGGNVGVGTSAPVSLFSVGASSQFQVNSSGVIAAAAGVTSSGTITFSGLVGCVGLATNGTGIVSCSSDEKLKDIHSEYTRGLDAIMGIVPQTYSWKADSYLNDGGILYSGVIAQNVEQFIPEAVNTGALGYKQVSQMTLIVTAINAIKELDLKIVPLTDLSTDTPQSLGSLMKQFLENANNTLQEVFFGKVHTKELCLDDVCITKTQLQQLLQQQNVQPNQSSGGGSSNNTGDVTPPAEESTGGDSGTPPTEEPAPPADSGTPPADVSATTD
ncbi:MAG: tail fiber domain-containing protein [bacterium]